MPDDDLSYEMLKAQCKALEETCRALRDGKTPPHYCAWCMSRIKNGGDPDHMLECKEAPFSKLMAMLDERDREQQAIGVEMVLHVGCEACAMLLTECGRCQYIRDLAEKVRHGEMPLRQLLHGGRRHGGAE